MSEINRVLVRNEIFSVRCWLIGNFLHTVEENIGFGMGLKFAKFAKFVKVFKIGGLQNYLSKKTFTFVTKHLEIFQLEK